MHSRFTRWAVGATVALSLFGAVGVAQASSLTSTQISAIIGLLQSFGADQSIINNVSAALGGQTSGGLLCSSFSNVSYGNFDKNPGGRVSQLQTWLGIPSSTFGFGTYGNKTRNAWNARCGTNSPQHSNSTFSATPILGNAPLTVNFSYSFNVNAMGLANSQFVVNFGDGTSGMMNLKNVAQVSHTYASAGTYTATISYKNEYDNTPTFVPLLDSSGNNLKQTITVN